MEVVEYWKNNVYAGAGGRFHYFFLITGLTVIENLMRALALDEIDSFLRSGGAENGEAHGVRHLHCRAANSPARAVHQDGFGSTRLRGVMQRMIRGPIGNPHSGALAKTDFFW